MNLKTNNFENNINKDFTFKFDEISGFDIASFHFNEQKIVGYFDKSPIEERIISKFKYEPDNSNTVKPFRAHWMIDNSKLLLGYVNGVINGTRLFTTDIVPEFAGDEILHHYYWYSGELKLYIQQQNTDSVFDSYIIKKNELLLTFKNGILIKIGNQKQ